MNALPLLDPHFELPAAGTVSCGNRMDLFRKQRVHAWHDAGEDIRWQINDGTFAVVQVKICITCGKDEQQ
jgi:hypothetical protein